jgi:hypothetical protein
LRGRFGPQEIRAFEAHREDRRCTTSKLLPRILELQAQGLSYAKIGKELGKSKKSVEHVMARHRKSQGGEKPAKVSTSQADPERAVAGLR